MNLDRRGGRVALDEGKARVDVRHRPNARWVFQAGPFEVRVHGTAFSVAWSPATTRFDLHMDAGVVSVVGPISGGEMVLRAGESLSVTLDHHQAAPAATTSPASAGSPALDRAAPSDAPPASADSQPNLGRDQTTARHDRHTSSARPCVRVCQEKNLWQPMVFGQVTG